MSSSSNQNFLLNPEEQNPIWTKGLKMPYLECKFVWKTKLTPLAHETLTNKNEYEKYLKKQSICSNKGWSNNIQPKDIPSRVWKIK